MTIDELKYIYGKRWGIETNYNTLKNRFYIENYSSKKRKGIEQDLYSKFFIFNNIQLPKTNIQQTYK